MKLSKRGSSSIPTLLFILMITGLLGILHYTHRISLEKYSDRLQVYLCMKTALLLHQKYQKEISTSNEVIRQAFHSQFIPPLTKAARITLKATKAFQETRFYFIHENLYRNSSCDFKRFDFLTRFQSYRWLGVYTRGPKGRAKQERKVWHLNVRSKKNYDPFWLSAKFKGTKLLHVTEFLGQRGNPLSRLSSSWEYFRSSLLSSISALKNMGKLGLKFLMNTE